MQLSRSRRLRALLLLGSLVVLTGCVTPGNYYGSSMAGTSSTRGTVIYQDAYGPFAPYGYYPEYGYGYGSPYYGYAPPPRVIHVKPSRPPVQPPRHDHDHGQRPDHGRPNFPGRPPHNRPPDHDGPRPPWNQSPRPPRGDHDPRPPRNEQPRPPRGEGPRPPRVERPSRPQPPVRPQPAPEPPQNDGRIPRALFGLH